MAENFKSFMSANVPMKRWNVYLLRFLVPMSAGSLVTTFACEPRFVLLVCLVAFGACVGSYRYERGRANDQRLTTND